MKELRHRVAVVTGAGSGIGLAIAQALAQQGMRLALIDIREDRLKQALPTLAGPATMHVADIANLEEVQQTHQAILAAHGAAHLLVNAAGVSVAGAFSDTSLDDFQWLMNINLGGTVNCCKVFLPTLLAQPEAHIVNVSSSFGLIGFPGKSAYAASKFAVRGFTESLRMELHRTNVGVTLLYPGPVNTNILHDGRAASDAQRHKEISFLSRRAIPPEKVARATLRGIRRNASRVLLSADYRAIDCITRLSPTLAQFLVGALGKRELDG